ncbi:hypothetical protein [Streptococcus suis]|uniref:hypothetical protein n=1 Tax=Streptococcus suis TaxID=1307 RepID=UPI00143240C3|nr:hypothetical protein [Streptococcus suis]NJW40431.1 hypothetical protein [Streptococcus suis]
MQSTETVYTVLALFAFLERKKKSPHRAIAPFQFLGHKLKRPVRVSIRFRFFMLVKKQSIQGLFF